MLPVPAPAQALKKGGLDLHERGSILEVSSRMTKKGPKTEGTEDSSLEDSRDEQAKNKPVGKKLPDRE